MLHNIYKSRTSTGCKQFRCTLVSLNSCDYGSWWEQFTFQVLCCVEVFVFKFTRHLYVHPCL